MYQIQRTEVFSKWLAGLRDAKGTARILARLDSVRLGNLGDSKSLGGGLHEMRIFAGPGYRLYFAPRGEIAIVLLCGAINHLSNEILREPGACSPNWSDNHGKAQRV